MTDEQNIAEVAGQPTPEPTGEHGEYTEADLMTQLETALASKDFKAVAAASRKLDTFVKVREKAELEVQRVALDAMTDIVKQAYIKAIKPIVDSGKLDAGQGIWISHDFGEGVQGIVVRLMKTAPRQARAGGGGGGGGKKFDISTDDMLGRHGGEEYKEGLTFQQAYESSTDKNWRYAIRQKLLKLEGII